MAPRDTPKSTAASGNTGIRMCIAKVPVAVTATSSPNGARPLASTGATIQLNQPATENQLPHHPAAEDLPPRQCSNPRNARRVALRHSLRAVNFDRAISLKAPPIAQTSCQWLVDRLN